MPIECPAEPDGTLAVEVCIARPRAALRLALRLPAGATVGDALRRAAHDPALDAPAIALLESAAGAARSQAAVDPIGDTTRESGRGESGQSLHAPAASRAAAGVFGKVRLPDWPLRDGDRVEVYRPLVVDPKVARQRRARQRAPGRSGSGALSRSG